MGLSGCPFRAPGDRQPLTPHFCPISAAVGGACAWMTLPLKDVIDFLHTAGVLYDGPPVPPPVRAYFCLLR